MDFVKKLILACICISCIHCTSDSPEEESNVDTPSVPTETETPVTNGITYEKDVKQIITTHCIRCHTDPPEQGAPMSLLTFEDVKNRSELIAFRMKNQNNPMPKSGLLPTETVQVIDDWIAGGLKEK